MSVLSDALYNPHPDVRRECLRICATDPHVELLDELLRLADDGGQERFLAAQALAFLDDDKAHEKVLAVARSEDLPRAERIRAVALLSRSQLTEAVLYLQELAAGTDAELREYAMSALAAMQHQRRR